MNQEQSEEEDQNLSEYSIESSLESEQKILKFDNFTQELPLNDTPQKSIIKEEEDHHSSSKSVELEIEPPQQIEE